MYRFEGRFRVDSLETEPNDVVKVNLTGNGLRAFVELPGRIALFKAGDEVLLSLSSEKDENYRSNWDVYMWGVVYYSGEGGFRVSIGGFILSLEGVSEKPTVGEKVYVGLKRASVG